ncbi:MAG: SH3 domain-containing protein [Candidatus Nealsonbacteria bacterium]|nr:SH3 domain-containing protein [Candidatus Nealsonbacteria bacterium]
MRASLAIAAFCLSYAVCGFASGDDATLPYTAYVTSDDVYVRSGPGQSYYPTEKLKAGQEVEVYRHDPGGWYAIRPPEGSFSWVSGRYLKPGVDNLAVVVDDRVAARVGSRFSDVRDVVQVRLHQAEVVEVLEKKPGPNASIWYKIAPPSGEFRWVFGKYVKADRPTDGVRKTSAAESLAASPAEADPAMDYAAVTPAASDPADGADGPFHRPTEPREMSPEEYQAALNQIDLELATMVVEEPTVWTFDALRHRADELLGQAETAIERGKSQSLLNKMARFEDLKGRYDTINLVRRRTDRVNNRLARFAPPEPQYERRPESDGRFDGEGQLARVDSPKPGAPRYALVDPQGKVRCYVSPAPGVPLQHYVGRQVGINGPTSHIPQQGTRHVTARHIDPLKGRRF